VFAACSHCPPLDPQNDQSLVAARFVPVNQVVQFELVDFSGIELGEAVTYVLEEPAQFIPVIATDELACGAPPPLSVGPRSLVFGSTTVRTYAANSRSPGISAHTERQPGPDASPLGSAFPPVNLAAELVKFVRNSVSVSLAHPTELRIHHGHRLLRSEIHRLCQR
jgi:hypothetical protein